MSMGRGRERGGEREREREGERENALSKHMIPEVVKVTDINIKVFPICVIIETIFIPGVDQ